MVAVAYDAFYDRKPDDKIIIDFEGKPRGWVYPLCELLDGWVVDIDDLYLRMRDLNGKPAAYEKKSLGILLEKLIEDSTKIQAIWIVRSGLRKKERIL